jgi:hypothetical protein
VVRVNREYENEIHSTLAGKKTFKNNSSNTTGQGGQGGQGE